MKNRTFVVIEVITIVIFLIVVFLSTINFFAKPPIAIRSEPQKIIKTADDLFDQQNFANALVEYWSAVKILDLADHAEKDPILLHAHLRIAELYRQNSWTEDARDHLELTAKIDPDYVGVRLLRGKLLKDLGKRSAATKEFLAVIEKEPTNFSAHYFIAVLYQGSKQFDMAIKHYKLAIKHDFSLDTPPSESIAIGLLARLQLSRTYRQMIQKLTDVTPDRIAEIENSALQLLESAIEIDNYFWEAKKELINLLYQKASIISRQSQAVAYEKAIGQNDDQLTEMRSYDQALEIYEKIVELDPTEIEAWQWIGQIYRSFLDEPESALEAYEKAYAIESDIGILAEINSLKEELK